MGAERSPINQVLAALDADRCLTPDDLAPVTGLPNREVVKAVGKLIGRGYAERREVGCYVLTPEGMAVRDSGEPIKCGRPRGPSGIGKPRRNRKPTHRDRLWLAMRIRGKFSLPDLLELTCDPEGEAKGAYANAQKYLATLARAGYLRQLPVREAGTAVTSNGFKRWSLVKDTGPDAPIWRMDRGEVYDPNTEETIVLAQPRSRGGRDA